MLYFEFHPNKTIVPSPGRIGMSEKAFPDLEQYIWLMLDDCSPHETIRQPGFATRLTLDDINDLFYWSEYKQGSALGLFDNSSDSDRRIFKLLAETCRYYQEGGYEVRVTWEK